MGLLTFIRSMLGQKTKESRHSAVQRGIVALKEGNALLAVRLLEGAMQHTGYDPDYYGALGRALLLVGRIEDAGRYLFLSEDRNEDAQEAIRIYVGRHHDPANFRQLYTSFPRRARLRWLRKYPARVQEDMRRLGLPSTELGD